MDVDKIVKRALLKPLSRRSQGLADRKAVLNALERLDRRALGTDLVRQLRQVVSHGQNDKSLKSWNDPERVRELLKLARALYEARQISTSEYVFYVASQVERIAEARVQDDKELKKINKAIKAIEKLHGLADDEYWPRGKGPKEYIRLNKKWEAISEKTELDAFREFGLNDLAELQQQRPDEYCRLRERGRRAVHHHDEYIPAIRDIIIGHEQDAKLAAAAKIYSAAVTSLGAGVEGLLLLRCLRSKVKANSIAQMLDNKPKSKNPTTWTFETLIEVCHKAGWLPPIISSIARYDSASLMRVLKTMRNRVHPGKQARERPWCETDERDYEDANAIYVTLLLTLANVRKLQSNNGP